MTALLILLCIIPVLLYLNKLRRRNKQNTFEWKDGDSLKIMWEVSPREYLGFSGKFVVYRNSYENQAYVCSLWRVVRNISLDERKAREFLKMREELI